MTVSDPPAVDFLVIGAMKAGTTWIDEMLRVATDGLLPPRTKETFFFDRFWDRGVHWYRQQLPSRDAPHRRVGEVASTYYASSDAAERAASIVPRARVLAVLREPGARSWSHYRHLVRRGELDVATSFDAACARRPEIVRFSRYDECLAPWRDRFGAGLAIVQFEVLAADPRVFAQQTTNMLALDLDVAAIPEGTRYGERAPRSPHLARVAHRASEALRRHGLHRVVDAGKSLGLDRLFERSARPSDAATTARSHVRSLVADDIAALNVWSGIDLTLWDD